MEINSQKFLEERTLPSQRITITQRDYIEGGEQTYRVIAPLPDGFGLTVGSEFATPFDTGNVNDLLSKSLFAAGISQKAGIRMQKMYSNPTPTEISFDMEFNSFYDAFAEVVVPSVMMLNMSLGRSLEWPSLKKDIERHLTTAQSLVNTAADSVGVTPFSEETKSGVGAPVPTSESTDRNVSKVFGFLGLVRSPPKSIVQFGDVMTIEEAYVTSVGLKFSNVLDVYGMPVSATASVTVTPVSAPITDDINQWFNIKRGRPAFQGRG